MFWDSIKNIVKRKFIKPEKQESDNKEWLAKLVENLENQRQEDIHLPFRIIDFKNTGFVVKVSGLFAFISFDYMPWRYNRAKYWNAVYPKLIGKVFFCKIHDIKKEPSLFILLNGQVHKFRNIELITGESYKGIVIEKFIYGVLVDIGYHFDWKCGSFIGLLHKSQFDSKQLYLDCSPGDEIDVSYQGSNEKGGLIFSQINEILVWEDEILQSLIGQIALVQTIRKQDEVQFLVNGKYRGRISITKYDCTFLSKKKTREARNNLKDGAVIHCEVTGIDKYTRILKLKWILELDLDII